MRSRSDTGELSLLAWKTPGRGRWASEVRHVNGNGAKWSRGYYIQLIEVIYGLPIIGNSDDIEWVSLEYHYCMPFQMWFFLQLSNSWQDFNWHSASRGLSAIAECLVFKLVTKLSSEPYMGKLKCKLNLIWNVALIVWYTNEWTWIMEELIKSGKVRVRYLGW